MRWVEKVKADLFFHNLRFDGEFIVNWLFQNGFEWSQKPREKTFNTIISNMGQWYMIDICYGYKGKKKLHTVIYDSLKKLPFPVKKIAKDFKLDLVKGEIDYKAYRPPGHTITDEEYKYIKNDIEIIADALDIQFKQGLDKMTNGSDSLHGFKDVISKKTFEQTFPVLSLKADDELRKAYRGGFTWVNDVFQGKEVGEGLVFDVNSLYPSVMYDKPIAWGRPRPFKGKYKHNKAYPLYIQHLKCDFELKEGYIPTIQIKKNSRFKDTEYLKSSNGERPDLYVTNVDWELIQEHYHVYDVEFIDGSMFRSKTGIFKDFIDKWMYIKNHSEGAIKQLAKLMLNSLYGKFASNPNVTGKIPYLKDDGSLGFTLGEEEFKDPVYTPAGIFITSWARWTTITAAQKCYDSILYIDTDSLHLLGTNIPEAIKEIVDDKRLGYWKHESTFKRAKFVRQKTYIEDIYAKEVEVEEDGETKVKKVECEPEEATTTILNVKCAGMPENVKKLVTFENFEVGFSAPGKLLPKHVPGGVVLVDTEFTLKGEKDDETTYQASLMKWLKEAEYDEIKEGVQLHGFMETCKKGDVFYHEYRELSPSVKRKYFRKTGIPIDVFATNMEMDVSDLIEKLRRK
jgi:hypothetical protein